MLSKKKIGFILILLTISAFLWYYFTTPNLDETWHHSCKNAERGNYSICCRENDRGVDCFKDGVIDCGKEIRVMFSLDFEENEYLLCVDRDTMIDDWNIEYYYDNNTRVIECVNTSKNINNFFWIGKIPNIKGKYTFADVYILPANLKLDYEDLLQNLDSYEKERIMEIRGDISC